MALACLAAGLAGQFEFKAATVDHGLRDASAAEAAQTARWCAALNLSHVTLRWEGSKPATGLQAAARAARYSLLVGHAEREGFDAIVTAHAADDQAETFMLRLARGSGAKGLAAMRGAAFVASGAGAPIALLRPFLDVARTRLRTTLESCGQAALDDPSNDDPKFERVRMRGLLAALEEQDILTRAALIRSAQRLGAAADKIAAEELNEFARAGGVIRRLGWIEMSGDARVGGGLAARLIRAVSGGDFSPDEDEAAAAFVAARDGRTATLGGAMVLPHLGQIIVCREPSAVIGRSGLAPMSQVELSPGACVLWDRRFRIRNVSDDVRSIRPLGASEGIDSAALRFAAPKAALAAVPAVSDGPADSRDGLDVECVVEERFDGKVIRFD